MHVDYNKVYACYGVKISNNTPKKIQTGGRVLDPPLIPQISKHANHYLNRDIKYLLYILQIANNPVITTMVIDIVVESYIDADIFQCCLCLY